MHFLGLAFLTNFNLVFGILGGYDIRIHHAPYQVNYGDICGGALIHKKWALTSAHCSSDHDFIRIGSSYRLKGPKVRILSHVVHPMFGHKHKFDYDAQLLKLFKSLYFSKLVSPIAISRGECGDSIHVSGWGYPKEKGEYQNKLQQAKMEIVPMKECQEVEQSWYNHTLTKRMFCAGGWSQDACQGDSGGAAVSNGKLVGLSSFGFGCGRKLPGVYTNVSESEIREWIRYHTGI